MIHKTSLKYFSLVELLVVFSVILILMSLLQPSLSRVINSAHQTKCLSTQRFFQSNSDSYRQDHDGFFIPALIKKRRRSINKILPHPTLTFWPDLLESEGYIEDSVDINCPSVEYTGIGMNYGEIGQFSYSRVNIIHIKSPSETAMLGDTAVIKNFNERNPDLWYPNNLDTGYIVWRTPNHPTYRKYPSRIIGRHNGNANVTFLDGSARVLLPSEIGLQYRKNHPLAKWDR